MYSIIPEIGYRFQKTTWLSLHGEEKWCVWKRWWMLQKKIIKKWCWSKNYNIYEKKDIFVEKSTYIYINQINKGEKRKLE
jgi:hypothetical protein